MKSAKKRTFESEKIIKWAYRDFNVKKIASKGQIIGQIPVWIGEKNEVALFPKENIFILIPATEEPQIKTLISYSYPITAPFSAGDKSPAKLKIIYKKNTETFVKEHKLYAAEGSKAGSFFKRMSASIIILTNYIKRTLN